MKKVLIFGALLYLGVSVSSCKKCSTCTFNDPEKGTITSEDVCQKGKQYRRTLDIYEKNGWACESKK
jgi:hypothetical protein